MSTAEVKPVLVSAAICTRNRPGTIGQAVASVLANDYPAFDLTVVDQSTTDATAVVMRPFIESDPRLHYLRVGEPGLSRARNVAIRHSTGDIIAFTDDDCVVPPAWLNTIVRAFAESRDADLLYGKVLNPAGPDGEASVTPALDIARPERISRRTGFKLYGMGANSAARRRLFGAIGGFDEMLGAGALFPGSDDWDLSYRTYRVGSVILLRPEIQVIHYGTRTAEDWPAQVRAYGLGDGAFFSKHVRCGDGFALRLLLTKKIVDPLARTLARRVLFGRTSLDPLYVRSILLGFLAGFNFDVDRCSRLYVRRGQEPGMSGQGCIVEKG